MLTLVFHPLTSISLELTRSCLSSPVLAAKIRLSFIETTVAALLFSQSIPYLIIGTNLPSDAIFTH